MLSNAPHRQVCKLAHGGQGSPEGYCRAGNLLHADCGSLVSVAGTGSGVKVGYVQQPAAAAGNTCCVRTLSPLSGVGSVSATLLRGACRRWGPGLDTRKDSSAVPV